jgi:dihydrofolate reductase
MFNSMSLDGYYTGPNGDLSWAHSQDPEWNAFVEGNASGGGELWFGRVTYEMMASYWPTPKAAQNSPIVAAGMNASRKVVFSKTMKQATWSNTTLVSGDLVEEARKMKEQSGPGIAILGSGDIVRQLTDERLIDEYQIVVSPIVLGAGKSLFAGIKTRLNLKLVSTRAFGNGNVVLCYEPMG